MKKLVSIIMFIGLLISCSPVKTTTSGLDNVAFLELYSSEIKYKADVKVIIDNSKAFVAKVNKNNKSMSPKRYQIPTGTHQIHIYLNDKEIYNETIFTSSQITKKITLP